MIYTLICHPQTPAFGVSSVIVDADQTRGDPGELIVEFHVTSSETLHLPEPSLSHRTDGLWRTTCFEVFIRPQGGDGYVEYNLSPSSDWAAYRFDGYRTGMRNHEVRWEPEVWLTPTDSHRVSVYSELDAAVAVAAGARLALSAVIEEIDGTKSYWALAHGPGPPDFHNPACFTATLPPPAAP